MKFLREMPREFRCKKRVRVSPTRRQRQKDEGDLTRKGTNVKKRPVDLLIADQRATQLVLESMIRSRGIFASRPHGADRSEESAGKHLVAGRRGRRRGKEQKSRKGNSIKPG
jgi:hypothetical protein